MQGKVMPEPTATTPVYVGIDVCKAWLDVYLHPSALRLRVANDRVGLKRLKRALAGHEIALIVMEATSKYHRQAHRGLHAGGFPLAIVNPLRARLFAEAVGALAKTDAIDAKLLAVFGESLKPGPTPPATQNLEDLQELVRARQVAVAEATALTNQRHSAQTAFLKAELARRRTSLAKHLARLEAEIERRIQSDPILEKRQQILRSIPGVGPVAAIALLVGLAEIGACSAKQASMLAGLAPVACDSGDKSGQRHIRGGRAKVRTAIYMAAVAATRANPQLKAFYKRLRDNGKPAKLALTAVMRKIVVLANTLIRENRLWQPIHA